MFLWVVLQIETLCAAKTDESIRQTLGDLPKNLVDTFSRILDKLEDKYYQRKIFELVTAACRPLTTDELREALSVIPGDTVWNPARLLNDVYSVLAHCGSLVIVDEEYLTVKLVHHSVKQFLLGGLGGSTSKAFTIESANRTTRDIVITYLNYAVFDTQLATTVVPQFSTGAMPSTIIRSALGTSSKVQELALRLLKTPDQSKLSIGKVLTDTGGCLNPPCASQFHFFVYAKSYWLQHSWYISEQEPAIGELLQQLLGRNIVDLNMRDEDGLTILLRTAERGYKAVVRLLLENGANIEAKDKDGRTPLQYAITNGHKAVVQLLLEKGANIEAKDKNSWTPLWCAVGDGNEAVVGLLLENGANIEAKDKNGWTPLRYAAVNGHEAVARLLNSHNG